MIHWRLMHSMGEGNLIYIQCATRLCGILVVRETSEYPSVCTDLKS